MITIDQYAYSSRLRGVSPAAKAVFAFLSLLVCVSVSSSLLSAAVFCVMAFGCVVKSGVGARAFLRLCAIPFWFVLIGALTVVLRFSASAAGGLALPLFGGYLVLDAAGASLAANLFLKSMGCVSCVYFLYVSTTVNELLGLLDRIRCPKLFIELTMMIYRFIFVLLGIAEQITIAQKARLGSRGFAASLRSAGILGSSVFIKAFKRSGDILNAMESRGYDGAIDYTEGLPRAAAAEKWLLAGYAVLLAAAAVACRTLGV